MSTLKMVAAIFIELRAKDEEERKVDQYSDLASRCELESYAFYHIWSNEAISKLDCAKYLEQAENILN